MSFSRQGRFFKYFGAIANLDVARRGREQMCGENIPYI